MKVVGLLFFILCAPLSLWARPDLPKPYVMVPLIIDGGVAGQVWAFPRPERKNFALEAAPLIEVLGPYLRADLFAALLKRKSPQGTLSLRDLDGVGLSADFSEESLEFRLGVPLKYRRNSPLNLNFNEDGTHRYLRPDRPSGYLNLRATQSYQYGDDQSSDRKMPLTGRADLVQNFGGFVFESGAEYTEQTPFAWQRQDTRIVWDSEENMLRIAAGDFTTSPRGFQSSSSAAGLAFTREFSIQPYRTAKPLGNSELLIKRPSLVEIYINGTLYTQIRLAPGRFNIKDFPIVNGQNDVRVKIKDDLGQEETFNFSVLFENTLLLQGMHEFGYFAGAPWRASGGDRAYDEKTEITSLFHRYGLTDSLTLGLNYQNFESQNLLGLEFSFITPVGFTSIDTAYGSGSREDHGYAERLKFRSLDRILGYEVPTILSLELEKRDPRFRIVSGDAIPTANAYETRVDAQLTRQFGSFLFAGLGAEYEKGGALSEASRTYRANLVLPVTTRLRLEGTYSETYAAERDSRVFLSLFWVDRPGRYSVSSYYDSQDSLSSLSLSRNNLNRYDDFRLNVNLQNAAHAKSADLSADYFSQPAQWRIENYSTQGEGHRRSVASLGVDTALAWVGTQFALTQPIQDSFAMVAAENMPAGQVLLVNPNGESSEAQVGPLHHVVLNQYTSYYRYIVNLDSTSLPMGYLLPKEFYYLQPTYKSGLLVPVHLLSRVMVKGRLITADKRVASYVVGDIYDEHGTLIDNNFFTNKEGVFVIEGLEPGRYEIRTNKADLGSIPLDVKANPRNYQLMDSLVAPKVEGEP